MIEILKTLLYEELRASNIELFYTLLGLLESLIQWINRYLVDSVVRFVNT